MKKHVTKLYVMLILSMLILGFSEAKRSLIVDNSIILAGQMPDKDSIEFHITAPKQGWIALGFGSKMRDANVFIITSNGENSTIHYGYNPKTKETSKISENPYSLSVKSEGDYNVYTVARKLKSKNENDYQIQLGNHEMVYAYGADSENIDYQSGNEGEVIMAVTEELRIVRFEFPTTNEEVKRRNLAGGGDIVHGILSYLAWCVLTILLVITGRYGKYFYITRNWIHTIIGIIVFILTVIVVAVTASGSDSLNGFGSAHKGIGGMLVIPTIIVCIIGAILKILQVILWKWTHLAIWTRYVHQYTGYACIIWGNAIFYSGLCLYGVPVLAHLFYAHLVI